MSQTGSAVASGPMPVLAGIGVLSQREDDPAKALDPLAMMIAAARRAGADATPSLLPRIQRILVPKGRWSYTDPARAVAAAIDAKAATTVLSTVGVLQQSLIGQACAAIAAGEIEVALVVGADAGYRILRARITGVEALSPDPGGKPDLTLAPKEELRHEAEIRAGLRMPVGLYAIIESAFRARRGLSVATHRDQLATLYSRFSAIAATNPAAWTRKVFPPEAIRTASERNPMQAFPYTKLMCSSWNVDQASALLFCSADLALRMGIARERWIYPWSSTESNHMVPVCARPELGACPGAGIAGRAALEPFGLGIADLDLIELYSCFPVAVEAYATALCIDMARDLTVTGGMSFAGGPYNNYVLQATARMAELLRQGAGHLGLVGSVSGVLTKQGFGLWSREPTPDGFRLVDCSEEVARVAPAAPVRLDVSGRGRIAGYTVVHDRGQAPRGIIVADIAGARTVACADDPELVARMEEDEFCGAAVEIDGNGFVMAA